MMSSEEALYDNFNQFLTTLAP